MTLFAVRTWWQGARVHAAPSQGSPGPQKRRRSGRPVKRRLGWESLEDRRLLAVLVVDTATDEMDGSIDDGDVSLRDAILAADAGDTIEFDMVLDGQTIVLTEGELAIDKSLTIDALSLPNGLTLEANDPTPEESNGDGTRVFSITDGDDTSNIDVTLQGLTLTGGDVLGAGGGVWSRENLTIRSSTITGNSSHNSEPGAAYEGDGGGVWANAGDGSIVIEDSTIRDNDSDDDGGGLNLIVANGSIAVRRSTVSGNVARGDDPVGPNIGGGIRLAGGETGSVTVEDSTVQDNRAEGPSSLGAGIGFLGSGEFTVERSTVSGNTAAVEGGGVHGIAYTGSINVLNSTIAENSALGFGGGLNVRTGTGSVRVEGTTVRDNTIQGLVGGALNHGAGIRASANAEGNVVIADSIVTGNVSNPENDPAAGASGSGVAFIGGGSLSIQDSTISGNTGAQFGGGVLTVAANTNIVNSTISGNDAFTGGGMYATDPVNIESSTISNNSSFYSGGGIASVGTTTISGSTLSGNTAGSFGGAIAVGRLTQTNTYPAALHLLNTTISGNSSESVGGALFLNLLDTPASTIQHSTITQNTSDSDSDGIGEAGGFFLADGAIQIANSIVAANTDNTGAAPDGALVPNGVDGTPPTLSVRFSLIGDRGPLDVLTEAPVGSPDANGNLIGGPTNGAIDPLLGPLANHGGSTQTHAVLPSSPVIDAGDPAFVGFPIYDQRGLPFLRQFGDQIDMGAVESQPSPADFNTDDAVDVLDINDLIMAIAAGENPAEFDLNDDGLVNTSDRDLWLSLASAENLSSSAPYRLGDANLDGAVDAIDFEAWNSNRFMEGTGWSGADFNGDNITDGLDFNLWLSNRFAIAAEMASAAETRKTPRAPLGHGSGSSPASDSLAAGAVSTREQVSQGPAIALPPDTSRDLPGLGHSADERPLHRLPQRQTSSALADGARQQVTQQQFVNSTITRRTGRAILRAHESGTRVALAEPVAHGTARSANAGTALGRLPDAEAVDLLWADAGTRVR